MKEYKLVHLNEGVKFSGEKKLAQAEEVLNEYVAQGWTLEQIVPASPAVLIGVFYKENPDA